MKHTFKMRLLSLAVTLPIIFSMVMIFSIGVFSTSQEIEVDDGAKWYISTDTSNSYSIKGDRQTGYVFEHSKTFFGTYSEASPVATSEWQLSLDYRYSDYARFGISKSYVAPNPDEKTTVNGNSEKIQFLYLESGRTVQIFVDAINPEGGTAGGFVLYHLGNIPDITRQNLANISFVKQDGSWYLCYRDTVLKGPQGTTAADGTAADVYSRLERYVGADFFENNTPAYFQFGARYDGTGGGGSTNYYFLPPTQKDNSWNVKMYGRPSDYNGSNALDMRNHPNIPTVCYPSVTETAAEGYNLNLKNTDVKTSYGPNAYETMSYAQLNYAFTLEELLTKKLNISPLVFDAGNTRLSIVFTNDPNAPALKRDIAKSSNPNAKMVAIDLIADASWVHAQLQTTGDNVGSADYPHSAFNSASGQQDYFDGSDRAFSFVQKNGSWFVQALNVPYADNGPLNFVFSGDNGNLDIFKNEKIYIRMGLRSPNTLPVTPFEADFKILNSDSTNFLASEKQKALAVDSSLKGFIAKMDLLDQNDIDDLEDVFDQYNNKLGGAKAFVSKDTAFKASVLKEKLDAIKKEVSDQAALSNVQSLINAINISTANELTASNMADYAEAIMTAFNAYDSLDDELKLQINSALVTKITGLNSKLELLDPDYQTNVAAVNNVKNLISLISNNITISNYMEQKALLSTASSAYNALTEAQAKLIPTSSKEKLTTSRTRIELLSPVYEFSQLTAGFPSTSSQANSQITINNLDSWTEPVSNARKLYNTMNNSQKDMSAADYSKLVITETRIANLTGDWYVNDSSVTYTGNKNDGWEFTGTTGAGASAWATTTGTYDVSENVFTWGRPVPLGGDWLMFGIVNSETIGAFPTTAEGVLFILRPQGSSLRVSVWYNNLEYLLDNISNFNYDGVHNFSMVEQENHWYLKIDNYIFNNENFAFLDNFMTNNSQSARYRIGSWNGGFRADFVKIGSLEQSGDWWFSNLYGGASSDGNKESGWNINIPAESYAQLNDPIVDFTNNIVRLNYNSEGTNPAPGFAFTANAEAPEIPTAKGSGVVVRLYTRPSTDIENTHVLVYAPDAPEILPENGGWATLFAISAIDSENVDISLVQENDGHWYLDINGTMIKHENDTANEWLRMDEMVNNPCYLRICSFDSNALNVNARIFNASELEPTPTEKFIALLNQYFDKIKAGDPDATTLLANAWNDLDFFTRNDVEAYLFNNDDEGFELLQIIKDYKIGFPVSGKDEDTNISFYAPAGVLPENTEIVVKIITSDYEYDLASYALQDLSGEFTLFDISLWNGSSQVTPDGMVEISIPVPAGYDGYLCKVYYIDDDGNIVDMNAVYQNGMLVFETDHFSLYAVIQDYEGLHNPISGDNINFLLFGALLLISVALIKATKGKVKRNTVR